MCHLQAVLYRLGRDLDLSGLLKVLLYFSGILSSTFGGVSNERVVFVV